MSWLCNSIKLDCVCPEMSSSIDNESSDRNGVGRQQRILAKACSKQHFNEDMTIKMSDKVLHFHYAVIRNTDSYVTDYIIIRVNFFFLSHSYASQLKIYMTMGNWEFSCDLLR
jgi:hypothetical protein